MNKLLVGLGFITRKGGQTECFAGANRSPAHEKAGAKLTPERTAAPEQGCRQPRNNPGKSVLSRQERYRLLIEKARASYPPEGSDAELTWCDACKDEINLWTYWQGRGCLEPDILLVGQDYGAVTVHDPKKEKTLEETTTGPPYEVSKLFPTDQNLMKLFRQAFGIDLNRKNEQLFFTNFLLGYRTGNTSGKLNTPMSRDRAFFRACSRSRRVWMGGQNFRPARQKIAGILEVFQDFLTQQDGNSAARTCAGSS